MSNSASPSVWVLNGPNLNLLGSRDPAVYGRQTLADIETLCANRAREQGLALRFEQHNGEGELVTLVQQARGSADALLVNFGAYSHTSIAIRDALEVFEGPIIEVHLSNLYAREPFRHHSYISALASGVIAGLGAQGYLLALDALASMLQQEA